MSPEKRDALSKLREQELALDKQSSAIKTILARLDTSFIHHATIGTSLYKAHPHHAYPNKLMQCPKAIESENFSELRHKFAEHVAATEQFSAIHSRDISFAHNINKRQHNVEQLASQDSRHRSYSVDDSSSFIGEDILKASQVPVSYTHLTLPTICSV